MSSHRRSRRVSKSTRPRHRRLRFEPLEDRRVLSAGLAPELAGMYLVPEGESDLSATLMMDSSFSATSASTGWTWTTQQLPETAQFSGRYSSLAVDASGKAHISYQAGDELRYAVQSGAGWNMQTIGSDEWGYDTSLQLDQHGRPVISYMSSRGLECVRWTGTSWQWFPMVASGSYSLPSLVLDSNGWPHVSYSKLGTALYHSRWNGNAWVHSTVDTGTFDFAKAVLSSNGSPVISYVDYMNDQVKLATWTGSSWNRQFVDSSNGGGPASMALDSQGRPHVAYTIWPRRVIMYKYWTGSAWSPSALVDDGASSVRDIHLQMTSDDRPRVAFEAGALYHGYLDSGQWFMDLVSLDSGQHDIGYSLDQQGRAHISYRHKYATIAYASGEPSELVPQAPTNVQASDGTYTDKIHISWESSSDATSYEVWRSTSDNPSTSEKLYPDPLVATFDDTTANHNTTYWYWVKAKNSEVVSNFSIPDTGYRSTVQTPQPPTDVRASKGAYANKIEVNWTDSPGATSYEVWRNPVNGTYDAIRIAFDVETTTYDDDAIAAGARYFYWIKAKNSEGTSDFSETKVGALPDYAGFSVLPAPTGVSASKGTYTDEVRIIWDSSQPVTTVYEVWRNTTNSTVSATRIADGYVPGNNIFDGRYDDETAVAGTTYWYWIKCKTAYTTSDFSIGSTGYVGTLSQPPDPPTSVQASNDHLDKVLVTWESSLTASNYEVWRNTSNHATSAKKLTPDTVDTSFADETAVPGITYWYWVKAKNASGTSDFSSSDSGSRPTVGQPPEPPTNVQASNGTYSDRIRVTWNGSDGATSYEVWRNVTNNSSTASRLIPDSNTYYNDYTAVPGTTYWYWVKARNEEGTSDFSIGNSGYRNSIPNVPSCVSPASGAENISLSPTLISSAFSDPNAGDTHKATQWQIATNSQFTSIVWDYVDTASVKTSQAVPANTLSHTTTYHWRVRHQDNKNAWSNWSAPSYFTTMTDLDLPAFPGTGFVTATVSRRGDLVVTGDNAANSVAIRPGNASGVWVVTGIGETRVNQSGNPQTLSGVTRDVIIRMQGGDDYVNMELPGELSEERRLVPRDLRVEMGAGNNTAVFGQVLVGRRVNVRNGAGDVNELIMTGCTVTRNVSVRGGAGSDRAYFSETHVGGNLSANLGGGADLLGFGEGSVGRDLNVRLGGGGGVQGWTDPYLDLDVEGDTFGLRNSRIGRNVSVRTDTRAGDVAMVWIGSDEDPKTRIEQNVNLRGGAGDEWFNISQATIGRDLNVNAGSGDDMVDLWYLTIGRNSRVRLNNGTNLAWINQVDVANRFQLNGGRGVDEVWVGGWTPDGLSAASARFTMGGGDDRLMLRDSVFADLDVRMSSGNNELFVEENRVTQRTRLRGGRGNDGITADLAVKNAFADLSVTNFNYELRGWDAS